jgi:hypothetical protein
LNNQNTTSANHISSRPTSNGRGGPLSSPQTAPQQLPHGYTAVAADLPAAAPATDPEALIHPELRSPPAYVPTATMMPAGIPPPPDHSGAVPGPSNTSPGAAAIAADLTGDNGADGRKAKRELSQSKRAAQNRAAQVSPLPHAPLCLPLLALAGAHGWLSVGVSGNHR